MIQLNAPTLSAEERSAIERYVRARKATAQADSTATTIAGLKADINSLLAKLRAADLLAP